MPKLNKVLVTSMVSEVEDLDFLANELFVRLDKTDGDRKHLSWKFASTEAIKVDTMGILKGYNGSAGEMYILLLELAYDRVHYILRLMLEFTEMNGDQLPYEKLREIIASFFDDGRKFECYTRVSSTARLLWWRLKILQEFKHSNSRISRTDRTTQTEMDFEMKLKVLEEEKLLIKQRLAHVDECRLAFRYQLAIMSEGKVALEKTVEKFRKDAEEAEEVSRLRQTKSTQTEHNEAIKEIEPQENVQPQSLLLVTPEDDPVMDMTKEILSNKEKIEILLRQNERLERALCRISQHPNYRTKKS